MSIDTVLIVAAEAEISRTIVRALLATAPPEISCRAHFISPGLEAARVSEDADLLLALHTSDSLRNDVFLRYAQEHCPLHWCAAYFIPPPSESSSILRYLDRAEWVFFAEERFYRVAKADAPERSEIFSVQPLPIEAEQLVRREPRSPLRIATTATAAVEFRLLPLLRHLEQACIAATLYCLCENSEKSALTDLVASFPGVELQLEVGRAPDRWRSLLECSDVAYLLSESAYDEMLYYIRMSLASGMPTLCSRFGSAEAFPEETHWAITPGIHEQSQIAKALEEIVSDSAILRRRTENAVAYASLLHEPHYVWRQLLTTLQTRQVPHSESRWRQSH